MANHGDAGARMPWPARSAIIGWALPAPQGRSGARLKKRNFEKGKNHCFAVSFGTTGIVMVRIAVPGALPFSTVMV